MSAWKLLVAGEATAEVIRLDEPLSLWGGIDPSSGRIIERGHPQCGRSITGRILAMPHGRGSSSSSSVLAEALRRGTGPAAIVLEAPDSILVVGSLVAAELYGAGCPIAVVDSLPGSGETWSLTGVGLRKVGT